MTGVSRLARAFRRAALPLAAYYSVTLGLPLANGAAKGGSIFVSHALIVLVVPLLLIVFACTAHQAAHALARIGHPRGARRFQSHAQNAGAGDT